MQARYYDPVIGRFLSNDPVGFAEGGWKHFNRYSYTANDPVNHVDPTGEIFIGAAKLLIKKTIKNRGNLIEAVVEVGEVAYTVIAPSSTPADRIIAAAELVSPVAPSDVRAARNGIEAAGDALGGRRGNATTRAQNQAIGDRVHANGGGVDAGLGRPEQHFRGPGPGNSGGRYSDGSVRDANGNRAEVQTVDTRADGSMTSREQRAAEDIAERSERPVVCVPKQGCE